MVCQEVGHKAGDEWQVSQQSFICIYSHSPSLSLLPELRKTSSGLLILHNGELYYYFIRQHNRIIIEIKCTINAMHVSHPKTTFHSLSMEKLSSMKRAPDAKKLRTAV